MVGIYICTWKKKSKDKDREKERKREKERMIVIGIEGDIEVKKGGARAGKMIIRQIMISRALHAPYL